MLNKLLLTRAGYLLGFVASFASVGLALWIQTRYQLNPCPLCISQRMVLIGLGLLFLTAAIHNPAQVGRKIYAALHVMVAIGGAGVAIRHWWLQAHRDSMVADCGVGFDYMFENFPL
ncbi:MAG: disulfide bond formation protein B, partial [Methylophilales bacterium]|nr:disulfide bond formation protein B [Methylophilales bacterium]